MCIRPSIEFASYSKKLVSRSGTDASIARVSVHLYLACLDSESADHRHWNAWGPDKSPSASRAASRGLTRPGEGETAKEAEGDGGSIDAEDITCSRCGGADAEDGNDILLCDYAPCGLAYHQRCCDPPLTGGEADLPAEDADWLCPRVSEGRGEGKAR